MSTYVIKNNYAYQDQKNNRTVERKYRTQDTFKGTSAGESNESILGVLPSDIDIFKEIPASILNDGRIANFLSILRETIQKVNLSDSTLSKLHVSENDPDNITIEWIFNFFRAYFSFEANGNDTYGFLEYDKDGGFFQNIMSKLECSKYQTIVSDIVNRIIKAGKYR